MLDFLKISTREPKRGVVEIYPTFMIKKSSDLMIRGGDFYAIWIEELGMWSTDEQDAILLIDKELRKYYEERKEALASATVYVLYMWNASTGSIDKWHKYCQKQMRDSFHMLDETLIFDNMETKKEDYASKRLPYPLEKGDISAYEKLISTLYTPEERHKIEWAVGSIITGDSKHIQKFMVLYGSAGTGKSTVLNLIQKLFDGYDTVFDAKALGMSSASFALESFKTNPLVAIQHDGDLSRIEDNTRLNSLVSHETMTVNEKFKSAYSNRFKCFLFVGSNKPVKITDSKSGLLRRLIDVTPSGITLPPDVYEEVVRKIDFELGAIAYHCKEVYLANPGAYDRYVPTMMMSATNDMYNFIVDSYSVFLKSDSTTLKAAWEMYKTYCDEAKVAYPFPKRVFKEELRDYFDEYEERATLEDGTMAVGYYSGFRTDRFETEKKPEEGIQKTKPVFKIDFQEQHSIFDDICKDCPAQYAGESGTPNVGWDNVHTTLESIDTSKLHYVRIPMNHIVIDFDLMDENGNKSFEKNLEAASKWPATYAELSKSGAGIHLHYFYTGDPTKLSRIYEDGIEIKVFTGKSSLRRKLSKCNNLPIATLSAGLPLKGEKISMIDTKVMQSEKTLRTLIKRNLNKEIHPGTKPSIDFIYKILEDAYTSGMHYDVSNMENSIIAFGANSTHQAEYCLDLIGKMHFKSDDIADPIANDDQPLVFYDIEVFPNLFLVNWKFRGKDKTIVRMINPKPTDIEALLKFRLVGFNCRKYDNHMLYARLMGYTNEQLFDLSQKIINGSKDDKNIFFSEAYNISYTDVYDFCSKKQSLKKWEIQLGIHHQELGLPWDQPVPEEMWEKVAKYCDNDVIATEAVFEARQEDFLARQILADVAGGTVNDTTNTLTAKMIFGNNKHPQDQFNYRFMGELHDDDYIPEGFDEYTRFNSKGQPVFPGYKYEFGKSTYRDELIGEGGKVYAEPGMYFNVGLLDITSQHPHSVIAEVLFGEKYTRTFQELVQARVAIKHEDWDKLENLLDGKLVKYVTKIKNGELSAKALAGALKIAINSVYGLTSAKFDNPFRDKRNVDNIVAKRGALFMTNLKYEVQKRGFTVAHIKTDSIKIPDATPEIIKFVMDYGHMYGYNFEHEATYEKMCIVNDAVYIAKFLDVGTCETAYGYVPEDNEKYKDKPWTATGTQFAVPYVFKKLFSKEPIKFEDMCETNSVTSAMYLDMNENLPDVSEAEKTFAKYEEKFKKGLLSDTMFEASCAGLPDKIAAGHNYRFIGKVGQFCPMKPGAGGGWLLREKDGKYYAVGGTKGYRWMEAEVVKALGKEDQIDRSYYDKLVTDAATDISKYGDLEMFISDDPVITVKAKPKLDFINVPENADEDEGLPFN